MIRNTAVTVCGPLNVNKLGVTYVHEHLMVKPQLPDEYYIPYTLDDEAASTEETRSFSAAGGETLVEMTPINYGRNVKAYQRIAQATGVQHPLRQGHNGHGPAAPAGKTRCRSEECAAVPH